MAVRPWGRFQPCQRVCRQSGGSGRPSFVELPSLPGTRTHPLTVAPCSPSSSRSATPRRTTRSVAPASAATTPSSESCPSVGLEASSSRVSCRAGALQSAEKPSAPGAVASGAGVEQRACVAECMRHRQSAQYKPSVCPPRHLPSRPLRLSTRASC